MLSIRDFSLHRGNLDKNNAMPPYICLEFSGIFPYILLTLQVTNSLFGNPVGPVNSHGLITLAAVNNPMA